MKKKSNTKYKYVTNPTSLIQFKAIYLSKLARYKLIKEWFFFADFKLNIAMQPSKQMYMRRHIFLGICQQNWNLSMYQLFLWSLMKILTFRSSHRRLYQKAAFKNFAISTGKHLCWSLTLIKLQACNFIKSRLQYRCFHVKLTKFFEELLGMAAFLPFKSLNAALHWKSSSSNAIAFTEFL